ncbi:MAG: hypothetical protein KGZ88_20775 [Methylomicrobium sp.]|nr:hypothetical protein [Methylomicrobium sp.]
MTFHIEWTHGVGRVYDEDFSFKNADPFFSVMALEKIGPDAVLVSADLSIRRLKKSDIADGYTKLREAGFKLMYCWRKVGRNVPRGAKGGKLIRVVGELAFWEVEL